MTKETLDWVNSRIKRPAYFWWNYPVTDYVRNIILQGPVYGLNTSLNSTHLCGIASNPMEHGEASKLALYGVADYSWNTANYNPIDNWERGLGELMPEAKEAYRTFAIHSCDTETGYRRDESWETNTFRMDNWTESDYQALREEFDRVEKAPEEIKNGCTNRVLFKELQPWLIEFGKLGTRGKLALELMRIYRSGQDNAVFWNKYVQNLMSKEERENYEAHKSGTMKLQPFYENAMDDMGYGFLARLMGETPMYYKGIGSFNNAKTTLSKLMFDNDSTTYYTSGIAQKTGDWIGIDLGSVRNISDISILQGRNSVDDVDYFDHALLEYSEDGTAWTPLSKELKKQYVIQWNGEPVKARYVRLKRLESARTNYATIRSFDVNPVRIENLGFHLDAENQQEALYAFDKRLGTSYKNQGILTFEVPENVKGYILLIKPIAATSSAKIKQLKTDGTPVSETAIDSAYYTTELSDGVSQIQIEGDVELFEIVPQFK